MLATAASLNEVNISDITLTQSRTRLMADAQDLTNVANIINLSPNLRQVNLRLDASVADFLHGIQMLRPNGPLLEKLRVERDNKPTSIMAAITGSTEHSKEKPQHWTDQGSQRLGRGRCRQLPQPRIC